MMVTTTTLGATHGIDRTCAVCNLTYRYAKAVKFKCQNCGAVQEQDPAVNRTAVGSIHFVEETQTIKAFDEIPLDKVLRSLNRLSSDSVHQLFERLAILSMVELVNRTPEPNSTLRAQVK